MIGRQRWVLESGCRTQGSQNQCQCLVVEGWFLTQLDLGSGVSWSLCWTAVGQDQGPAGSRAGSDFLWAGRSAGYGIVVVSAPWRVRLLQRHGPASCRAGPGPRRFWNCSCALVNRAESWLSGGQSAVSRGLCELRNSFCSGSAEGWDCIHIQLVACLRHLSTGACGLLGGARSWQ